MRRLAALSPEAAPIAERTVADGLVFASKFARLINFYNARDRREGDWSAFFDKQPLVQYALLAATDVTALGKERRHVMDELRAEDRPPEGEPALHEARPRDPKSPDQEQRDRAHREVGRSAALRSLLAILRRANDVHRFFSERPEEKVFLGEVDAAIRLVLAKALRQGADALAAWEREGRELLFGTEDWRKALPDFAPALWSVGSLRPTDEAQEEAEKPGEKGGKRHRRRIREALWAASRAEQGLVAAAQRRLDELLDNPQKLAPHFALYLNFLRQHQYAQQRLNGLTGKHLDFYYETILEEAPRPAVGDSIYFAVQSDPKLDAFTLPAGARLTGKDAAGQAMVYQTEAPLELSGMALAEIATLYVAAAPVQAAAVQDPALTRFYLGRVAQPAVAKALAPATAWAPFGEEPAGGAGAGPVTVTPAAIGFALASPYLHLEEGTRCLELTFRFHLPFEHSAPPVLLDPLTFQVSYSGSAGWVPVNSKDCTATSRAANRSLTFCIPLSPGDPACVNFNPAKLDGPFAPDWPVLRVQFPNPLAFARQAGEATATAAIASITLKVAVDGMTDLVLANDDGPIAPTAAILPFGNQPQPGSAFLVGKAEVFRKKFTDASLQLDWANLPDAAQYPQGWRSYYREYVYALTRLLPAPQQRPEDLFGNYAYRVKLGFLASGAWRPWRPVVPGEDESTYALFETGTRPPAPVNFRLPGLFYTSPGVEDGPLKPSTIYAIPQEAATPPAPGSTLPPPPWKLWRKKAEPVLEKPSYQPLPLLAYTPQCTTGFFRLLFVEPEYGFGQLMYSRVASLIAMANAGLLIEEARKPRTTDETAATRKDTAAVPAPPPESFFGGLLSFGTKKPPAPQARAAEEEPPELTPMPNPPIAPALRRVTLGYRAQTTIHFAEDDEPYGFFHLTPLTAYLVAPGPPGASARPPALIEHYEAGGYLYLGLSAATLPQSITLLAIIDEAPVAAASATLEPAWSFLTGTGWLEQPAAGVHDGTYGFQKSGLLHLTLPKSMSDRTGVMPPGLFWMRAHTAGRNAARVMRLVLQAGSAKWLPPDNAPPQAIDLHLNTSLPPGSLKAFEPAQPGILLVEQFLPSFGGRPAESRAQMQVRLSERLRHKDRAWTPGDYERLLLQEFPNIYYALCLPATKRPPDEAAAEATGQAAGHVLVLVLPALAAPPPRLPAGFHAGDLLEMKKWLRERMSPMVQVEVANPDYLYLQVTASVTFLTDKPVAVYTQRLNAELKAFISPWMYQQPALAGPPQQEFPDARTNDFIASRAYVKTVKQVSSVVTDLAGSSRPATTPRSPWHFLITADQHKITT